MSNPLPSTAWKVGDVANGRVCIESLGHIWCLYFREKNTDNMYVDLSVPASAGLS